MKKEVKKYIEDNVFYFEPVFHVFNVEVDGLGNGDITDYNTENDMDRKGFWLDNLTKQQFRTWSRIIRHVEKVLE